MPDDRDREELTEESGGTRGPGSPPRVLQPGEAPADARAFDGAEGPRRSLPERRTARSVGDAVRTRPWDFALTVLTVALLGALGTQSFLGMLYTWWAERTTLDWSQSPAYVQFVDLMNLIAAPQVVALVVVMGLCVPKRLFSRRTLVGVSAAMLAAGVAAGIVSESLADGLAAYLALAALIQLAVVVMTLAGTRSPSYLTEGRLTKLGSGLLHLGFVLFAIVVVALQRSELMMPVFWVASTLMLVGTTLSFYASAARRLIMRPARRVAEER